MWWLAKCLVLAVSVLAYAFLTAGIVVTYTGFSLFLNSSTWSTLALTAPNSWISPFFTPRNASASTVIGQIVLLPIARLVLPGAADDGRNSLSCRFLVGYITALVVLFASFAVYWVSDPLFAWTNLFIYKHLMFAITSLSVSGYSRHHVCSLLVVLAVSSCRNWIGDQPAARPTLPYSTLRLVQKRMRCDATHKW